MHKILRDFKIETDYLILARRPDLELINKKKRNYHLVDFCHSSKPQSENKRKQKDWKVLSKRTEKTVQHEGDSDTNCSQYTQNNTQEPGEGISRIENQCENENHSDIAEIS